MATQRFTDALSGADGTQAVRLRYDVPPVYPDGTVPVVVARPVTAPVVQIRIPVIDPRVAAEVQARVPVRPRPPPAPRPPRVVRGAGTAAPAAPPPSRAQAARAGYFQGPVPTAIGPAAPSQHRSFPAPPTASLQSAADRLRSQLGQFGTGNARSQPATPSSPQAGRRSAEPAAAFRPAPPPARRKGGWAQSGLVVIILFLVVSGVGAKIVDAVMRLLQR